MPTKQRLLNRYEEVTYEKLKTACEPAGAHVFPKVRVADVVSLENLGLTAEEFSYGLKSHFDFVVTDKQYSPLFSVEYDGPLHKTSAIQILRDSIKNNICRNSGHPLLRINSRYLDRQYRGLDLLTYFVDVWFLQEAFDEAQRNGGVPYDEPFDPAFVYSDGTHDGERWPYWLSIDLQARIHGLYEQKRVDQMVPSHWVGVDKAGNYRCLSWLALPNKRAIYTTSGMRSQNFPVVVSDLLGMLGIFDVFEKVQEYLRGEIFGASRTELNDKIAYFERTYEMRAAGTCGSRS